MYKNTLRKISQSRYAIAIAVVAFVAVIVISMVMLFRFAEVERRRDMVNWENRLNIIADHRASIINEWVERQFAELKSLAQNQSLQLYASEIMQEQDKHTEDPFQVSYLRNLLTFTAERSGFSASAVTINANVPTSAASGIAVLDKDKNILVSTHPMPPLADKLAEIVAAIPSAGQYISNMYKGVDGRPTVVFSVPIIPVQGDEGENNAGFVVGIRTVDDSLFLLLKQPGVIEKTAETILVSMEGGTIHYLSPTADGTPALSKKLNSSDDLEAAFVIQKPGQFAEKRDYAFAKVLVTGRKITHTPWSLVYKINRGEAIAESETHISNVLTIGIITIFFITAVIIAMWQYANVIRESRIAERYRKMMLELKSQRHILRLITDNKPEVTLIVDGKNRCRFANFRAAQQFGISEKEMLGLTLVNIMGKDKALPYIKMNATALADNKIVSTTQRMTIDGEEKVMQSRHIPLRHIPSGEDAKSRTGVLILEQDITEPIQAKEKLVRTLDALIDTLVSFMDKRDKHTADHSTRVARLAGQIAKEMGLGDVEVATVTIAGKLMNIGRALIPVELLNKLDELTEEEKKIFEETTNVSAQLLGDIEFDGPVAETIQQSQECVDGNGPLKLKENNILITARIVVVANAFVSMRSPRAYRLVKTIDETIELLQRDAGTKFDRKVVAALVNYIENRGGREDWKSPEEIPALWVS